MKKVLFLLFVTVFGLALIPITAPRGSNDHNERNSAVSRSLGSGQARPQVQDPPGTINGSQHPELISDRAAYTILFLVLANRSTTEEQIKARAYLSRFDPALSEADIVQLLSAADEYQKRVSVFNKEAKLIKDMSWPNPDPGVFVSLQQLQAQKNALVDEVRKSLYLRISASGLQTITAQALPYIKSKIKLAPQPSSLPGGPDWKPTNSHH